MRRRGYDLPGSPYALDSACCTAPADAVSLGCCSVSGEGGAARQTSLVRPSPAFQTRRAERQSSPAGFSASSRGWSMAAGIWNQPAQHRFNLHSYKAVQGSALAPAADRWRPGSGTSLRSTALICILLRLCRAQR